MIYKPKHNYIPVIESELERYFDDVITNACIIHKLPCTDQCKYHIFVNEWKTHISFHVFIYNSVIDAYWGLSQVVKEKTENREDLNTVLFRKEEES